MHPELVPGWSMPVHSYGVMLVIAFYSAYFLARWTARREGIDANRMVDLLLLAAVLGIVGARAFYVIQFSEQMDGLLDFFALWKGGLVFYGGLGLAAVGIIVFMRWKRLSVWRFADAVAPAVMLGLALGRVGCFLNGCCWGARCEASYPFGVRFPRFISRGAVHGGGGSSVPAVGGGAEEWRMADVAGTPWPLRSHADLEALVKQRPEAWRDLRVRWVRTTTLADGGTAEDTIAGSNAFLEHLVRYPGEVKPDDSWSLRVHPTQLYETCSALTICGVLVVWRRWRRRSGEVFWLMLCLYAVARFVVEGLRSDTQAVLWGLTIAQVIGLAMFAAGVAGLAWCRGGGRRARGA